MLVLEIASAGAQICAPSGGPNCKCWCSKSPRLVLKIASAGAQNRLRWRLVLKIASAGAQNRLGWCSKSPRLVLEIASAGAQNVTLNFTIDFLKEKTRTSRRSHQNLLKENELFGAFHFFFCWYSNLCVLWWSQLQVLVLKIASAGAQNRLRWCSKSPRLVLKIASAGAQICASSGGPNCKCWCSKSPRLVLKIASAGAQNRLRWCSKSPRLVLKIASAGAQICASSGAFFSCTLRPNHI